MSPLVELLYRGTANLGVDQILEAHSLAKLLGLNVTLEFRNLNEGRRRQEKRNGGGEVGFGGDSSGSDGGGKVVSAQRLTAEEFRQPHPPGQSYNKVNSALSRPATNMTKNARSQRRHLNGLKLRSNTVARASNMEEHMGETQFVSNFALSKGGDHCHRGVRQGRGGQPAANLQTLIGEL